MFAIEFAREEDFDTERHQRYRDDGWIGGTNSEVCYFLSCLTRINYFRMPQEVWEPAAKQYINSQARDSAWITRSNYFHQFAVLILKKLYRQSKLSQRYPIRKEHRTEKIARNVIAHADLSIDKLAILLKTTVKQIERNSSAMFAHREFHRLPPPLLTPDPHDPCPLPPISVSLVSP
jgi:hypothetical protein